MSKLGIIGGSGIYSLDEIKVINEHNVETPFGNPSGPVIEASISDAKFFFLARHGQNHQFLPSEVNYRANIYALKKVGVNNLISVSAVGSLQEECAPTDFVLPDQFIDWTKGKRERTFFGDGVIGHVSVANPIVSELQEVIANYCKKLNIKTHIGGSYICIEGPQFSTKAESNIYRSFGARIIGMTNVPEAYLAKEAGIGYATIGMVTDFDCWKDHHCTVDEIMKVMKTNNEQANKLLKDLIPHLSKNPIDPKAENHLGILSSIESLSEAKKEVIETLLKK